MIMNNPPPTPPKKKKNAYKYIDAQTYAGSNEIVIGIYFQQTCMQQPPCLQPVTSFSIDCEKCSDLLPREIINSLYLLN